MYYGKECPVYGNESDFVLDLSLTLWLAILSCGSVIIFHVTVLNMEPDKELSNILIDRYRLQSTKLNFLEKLTIFSIIRVKV